MPKGPDLGPKTKMLYRVSHPITVLAFRDNHQAAVTIPPGDILEVIGPAQDDRFVIVSIGRVLLTESEIHFATNQSAVPAEAEATLSDVARKLNDNPAWRVRVEGYTDNVGSKAANQNLSRQRATAVTNLAHRSWHPI